VREELVWSSHASRSDRGLKRSKSFSLAANRWSASVLFGNRRDLPTRVRGEVNAPSSARGSEITMCASRRRERPTTRSPSESVRAGLSGHPQTHHLPICPLSSQMDDLTHQQIGWTTVSKPHCHWVSRIIVQKFATICRKRTPSGRLMFQIIGAMAEFERALIQERVRVRFPAIVPSKIFSCSTAWSLPAQPKTICNQADPART